MKQYHYNYKLKNLANPDEEIEQSAPVSSEGYTQKQLLKEETEAPFRLVRIYIYISLLASASLSALICFTKILALTSGSTSAGDLNELYQNLGINLGGIPILAYLWKRDLDSRNSILERIKKGGSLAGLRIKTLVKDEPMVVKLSDLRRDRGIDKRVVIVAARKESLKNSLMTSVPVSKSLVENDLLIVPLAIESDTDGNGYQLTASSLEALLGVSAKDENAPSPADLKHIGLPVFLNQWNDVIKKEIDGAIKQQPGTLDKGITIVIKKNGKVGTRRFGVPIWETLVDDVSARATMGLDVRNI